MRALGLLLLTLPAVAQASVDRIVVDKTARTLTLFDAGKVVRVYRDIKLGQAPRGPKHVEGDQRTPEGNYTIDGRNGGSHYHRSLRVSYPDAHDRAVAVRLGKAPGGNIFIHGQPNQSTQPRIPVDWTDGCIAVSNADMDEIWRLVGTGTRVMIRP